EREGPFGESHGHVALEDFNMSMRVTAVTQRKSPVFTSIISQVTPSESSVLKKVAMEPLFFTHLRQHLGIKEVRRVVMHEPLSNLRKIILVQYAQGTPRTEIWRGLHAAATLLPDCGTVCIAVSEDIAPTNADAVFWRSPTARTRWKTYISPPIAPPAMGRNLLRGRKIRAFSSMQR